MLRSRHSPFMGLRTIALCFAVSLGCWAVAGSDQWCLYFVDANDGNIYRSYVDGTHRELVVRCGVKQKASQPHVNFAVTWPDAKTRGALHVGNIPSQSG